MKIDTACTRKVLKSDLAPWLYRVNSCIIESVNVLYFCYEKEYVITTFLVKSKIRCQNTLPKYVTKYNVFCVTYS